MPACVRLAQVFLQKIDQRIDPGRTQTGWRHDDIESDITHAPFWQDIDQLACIEGLLTQKVRQISNAPAGDEGGQHDIAIVALEPAFGAQVRCLIIRAGDVPEFGT